MSDVPPDHGKLKQAEDEARLALFSASAQLAHQAINAQTCQISEIYARSAAVLFTAAFGAAPRLTGDVPPDHGKQTR